MPGKACSAPLSSAKPNSFCAGYQVTGTLVLLRLSAYVTTALVKTPPQLAVFTMVEQLA
jgi:hypothetical protein